MIGRLAIPALVLASGLSATAQTPAPPPVAEPAGLQAVDQGIADVGPLNSSLRVQRADLRIASGFDRVYQAPGQPDMLMRVNGALRAVFSESEYVRTEQGAMPLVPAGTTWIIGDASAGCTDPAKPVCNQLPAQQPFLLPAPRLLSPAAPPAAPPPPNAVSLIAMPRADFLGRPVAVASDARIDSMVAPTASAKNHDAPRAATGPTSMPDSLDLSDPFYRRARLREIARRYGPR